jgi:hypothetical protein
MRTDAQRATEGGMTMDQTEARALEDEAHRLTIDSPLLGLGLRSPVDYFDRAGRPISLAVWAWLLERPDYRRVALDGVGPCHVSTVWLGIDHSFGQGPPVIFETMVFSDAETWRPEWGRYFHEDLGIQHRYCTEAQALAGHAETVAALAGLAATIDALKPEEQPDVPYPDLRHDQEEP